ncbi:vWA domain-containing protein [Marichromatium bheemlicum]|uniref:VWA domain-containing protein n=1 Tax=Marichromatium bheemlicum TaxID=365339 RepID=A0ABX1I3S1_9GAMM|nr:vWA domain-containing protein [Marichromatium bheemlicum]NKN31681.1 VWA domain-containing protein [Marichromatium bheemlicum]
MRTRADAVRVGAGRKPGPLPGMLLGVALVASMGAAAQPTDVSSPVQRLDRIEAALAAHERALQDVPAEVARRALAEAQRAALAAQLERDRGDGAALRARLTETVTALTVPLSTVVSAPSPAQTAPLSVPATLASSPRAVTGGLTSRDAGRAPARADFSVAGLEQPLEGAAPGLWRRVLSRPDAQLRTPAGELRPLDTFSVLYVYGERTQPDGQTWLAVGARADRVDGWVRHHATEDWTSMLVMEYAPRTDTRGPVLFFSSRERLADVVAAADGPKRVERLRAAVAQGENGEGSILTVEPRRAVAHDATYLMPILGHQASYFNYGAYLDVMLLQLAGLTETAVSRAEAATTIAETSARGGGGNPLADFHIGVAFVIDTTRSMGPYIEATKDFVRNIYARLDQRGLSERFRFALVGFRDNITAAPGAGYVTRVFSDLTTPVSGRAQLAEIDAVQPATVSTVDWREDAFAGLRSAAHDLHWDEVDARLVLLITDASARAETDDKARHPGFGSPSVRAIMDQRDISVHVLHLRTAQARELAGGAEIPRAQAQYEGLGRYYPVEGSAPRTFGRALAAVEDDLVGVLVDAAAGREIAPPADAEDQYRVLDLLAGREVLTEDTAELAARPILSDLFRYQQVYLGAHEGVEPPKFYRAWAADRDLINQHEQALRVSVLVTRAQLEALAAALARIIDEVDSKQANLSEFHDGARSQAGRAVVDPLLPAVTADFLKTLPYRSKLLGLDREQFLGLGQGQEALLNEVRAKLAGYREILTSDQRWMRLSERSEEQLYPLPLRDLP